MTDVDSMRRQSIETFELEQLLRRPSLRQSLTLPQRAKIVEHFELTKDTTCGIGCIKSTWLQSFANTASYVLIYGLVGCIYTAWYAYFNGCITTMEKQFKIPSRVMGVILSGSDIIQIIVPPVLSYYTDKGHRPRWIALGLYGVAFSCFVMALPNFIYGPGQSALQYTYELGDLQSFNETSDMFFETQKKKILCDSDRKPGCEDEEEHEWIPIIIFMGAGLINGVGGCLYYTLGTTYMDDNIEKSKTPALVSFSFFIKTIGPSLGYWLSSVCLKIFVAPRLTPTVNDGDPRWIGAWWLGWIILGIILFISASILGMFPKVLPEAAKRAAEKQKAKNEEKTSFKDMLVTMKRLLCNPLLTFNNLASVSYVFGFMAYWIFMPKYIELQYRQTASISNIVTGTASLVFSAGGILIAGVLITKYKFRARILASWNVVTGLVTTLGMIAYVQLGCSAAESSVTPLMSGSLTGSCYANCTCDFVPYSPVCGANGFNYISPCHAGCLNSIVKNDTKEFIDCLCIDGGTAKDGPCPVDCFERFAAFIGVVCFLHFIGATGRASNFLVQIRSVEERDKSVSLAYGLALMSLFAFMPSPIIFGYILDTTCLVWGKTCSGTGNCWVYDTAKLRYLMNYTAATFVFIGAIFDAAVWYYAKGLKIFDDEEETSTKNKK